MVVVATAIVAIPTDERLLSVLVVGMTAGIYWPQLRHREWAKLAFNTGTFGLAALTGAATFTALPTTLTDELPAVLAGATIALIAYWIVNTALLTIGLEANTTHINGRLWPRVVTSDTALILCAIGGAFSGALWNQHSWELGLASLGITLGITLVVLSPRNPWRRTRRTSRNLETVTNRIDDLRRDFPDQYDDIIHDVVHAALTDHEIKPRSRH